MSGTVIITEDRLCASADTDHRRSDQKQITLCDGSAGDQHIPLGGTAVFLKNGIHKDQDKTVRCKDHEWRKSKGNDSDHNLQVILFEVNLYRHFFSKQEGHGENA